VKITVILCTYNRCRSLARALSSAAALNMPDSVEWEVLVVDNNSRDDTRKVVEEFERRYRGRFRYLFEPKSGKSHALNSGIRESRADIVAFMDDDVTVHPDWLQNLTAALKDEAWAGAGGRILAQWTTSPPRWLTLDGPEAPLFVAVLAMFDQGPESGPLNEPPFGTNMAFRKSLFERYGGFRADLGPRPDNEMRSEDTEFGRRLLTAGERLRYEPSAVVYHPVAEQRIRKNYFLNWYFDKGRADVLEFGVPNGVRVFGRIPLHLFRRVLACTVRWMLAVHPRRRFFYKLQVWLLLGEISESYRQSQPISQSVLPKVTQPEHPYEL
jgi:glycosyltransferase involved in cell wall biosynthesis